MKPKAVVILAQGFEEMEAVISIDMLRRAGIEVVIAHIGSDLIVKGSRDIPIQAQVSLSEIDYLPDAVILPGGMPGAANLENSETVISFIKSCFQNKKIVAAICASPAHALVRAGVLDGKAATCYPGAEELFPKTVRFEHKDVVVDDNIITSAGPGTGFDFAIALIKKLSGDKTAATVAKNALVKNG